MWLHKNGATEKLHKGYGMCECGGTVTASTYRCNMIGSAGIPTPHVVVSAFDVDTGVELKYGKRGELRVLSPCRMLGYYKNSDATSKYFYKNSDGNTWACTGDMGYITEDGNVYVSGRISDSYVNDNGETIYLFDIERAVLDISQVRQCKTVISNIDGLCVHVCHIVLEQSAAQEEALSAIRKHCAQMLPEHHIPNRFKLYDDALPVAPSGKLDVTQMQQNINGLITI